MKRPIRNTERFSSPADAAKSLHEVADSIANGTSWVAYSLHVTLANEADIREAEAKLAAKRYREGGSR